MLSKVKPLSEPIGIIWRVVETAGMIDASLEAQFKSILLATSDKVKPLGFKKRGMRMYRAQRGNLNIIEFQRSLSNDAHKLRFTVNIGVISTRLARLYEINLAMASCADAHLRDRIGNFLPEPTDKWWQIQDDSQTVQVVGDISELLTDKVVPYLDDHSSDETLVALWENGQSPGLTDLERRRYLNELKAARQAQ
jgi:hypothetical protein